jgi:hypothetical protein
MALQLQLGRAAQARVLFLLLVLTASCYGHARACAHAHDAVSSSLSILTRRPPPLSATMMKLRGGSTSSWGRTPSINPQGTSGQMQMTTAVPVKTEPPDQFTEDDTKELIDSFLTRDSRNSFICE